MNYFNKFIFIIFFFCVTNINAQNKDLYNVKLKTGLVIKCELLKVVTDSFVVIRQYGQVNTIQYNEIESIQFVETRGTTVVTAPDAPTRTQPVKEKPVQTRRNIPDKDLSFGLQTGLCFGQTDDFPTVSILLRLSVLTGITKRLQVGGAIGLDPYLQYNGLVIGSLLGEMHYYFKKDKPESPFFHSQFGFGFNLNSDYPGKDGGLSYLLGLGQSFRDQSQNIFSMMLGYRFQKASEEDVIWGVQRTVYHEFNRVEFKVEFRF